MIAHLTGKIIARRDNRVVVDVGGVGYAVAVSDYVYEKLVHESQVSLHVYTHVREQALELYGFQSGHEQELFELLIGVSGIGPKAAMSILSVADSTTLANAIVAEDVSILTQVSGVGKKTAQRVVLELKNKVSELTGDAPIAHSADADALEALCTMGYSVSEARDALNMIDKDIADIGDKVRAALIVLAK